MDDNGGQSIYVGLYDKSLYVTSMQAAALTENATTRWASTDTQFGALTSVLEAHVSLNVN